MNAPADSARSGLALLEAEMARQHRDALDSIRSNAEMAARVGASIMRDRRLLLTGMGASHYANRIVEPLYRRLGVEAWALTAAELIHSPPPAAARTMIFVSQSGESGEIVELLKNCPDNQNSFGITLDPSSTLGCSLPCLVGTGGSEVAFAATRSLFVTLALHAAILSAIDGGDDRVIDSLLHPVEPQVDAALAALADKTSIIISGRGVFRGVAETASLMLMELARMPALGFEIGQFRHGPMELLSPAAGVVLLCGGDADRLAAQGLARMAHGAGASAVIFDCSGKAPLEEATTIALPPRRDLGAVLAMLPSLQRLIIAIAARKVDRVGEPIHSTKITRETS